MSSPGDRVNPAAASSEVSGLIGITANPRHESGGRLRKQAKRRQAARKQEPADEKTPPAAGEQDGGGVVDYLA